MRPNTLVTGNTLTATSYPLKATGQKAHGTANYTPFVCKKHK